MKKTTKFLLHALVGGIVSAISFIGFKKGIQAVNCKMEKEQDNLSEPNIQEEPEVKDADN